MAFLILNGLHNRLMIDAAKVYARVLQRSESSGSATSLVSRANLAFVYSFFYSLDDS